MTSLAVILLSTQAMAGCEETTNNGSITSHLDSARTAYENLDIDGFQTGVRVAVESVPCMTEPLQADVSARLHRSLGLIAFSERDPNLAESSFAAARVIEPLFTFPDSMIPAGNPVLTHYNAMDLSKVSAVDVAAPAHGTVWIDGARATTRRQGLPLFFQQEDVNGALTVSQLVRSGAPLPPYEKKKTGSTLRRPLLIGAASAIGASLVTAAVTSRVRNTYCSNFIGTSCTAREGVTQAPVALIQGLNITAGATFLLGGTAGVIGLTQPR